MYESIFAFYFCKTCGELFCNLLCPNLQACYHMLLLNMGYFLIESLWLLYRPAKPRKSFPGLIWDIIGGVAAILGRLICAV